MDSAQASVDISTCSVCLEDMLYKKPRLLSCHHSFCSECLQGLVKDWKILCPLCRQVTNVPFGEVKSLKVNFYLQEFRSCGKNLMCGFCLARKAVLKCQECAQIFCDWCKTKHEKFRTFQDHKVEKLCPRHEGKVLTQICMKCARVICSQCAMTEHCNHATDVHPIDEGLKYIDETVTKYGAEINSAHETIEHWKETDRKKLDKIPESIHKVEKIRGYYEQKLNETEEVLKTLKDIKRKGDEMTKIYERKTRECYYVKSLLRNQSGDFRDGTLGNYFNVKEKLDKFLNEIKEEDFRFNPDCLDIFDPITSKRINLINNHKVICLEEPRLVSNVCQGQWESPWNLSKFNDESVLICDWGKEYLTLDFMIHNKPSLKIKTRHGIVRDACIYQRRIYIAYENSVEVSKIENGGIAAEIAHKRIMRGIYSIAALNATSVFVLSKTEKKIIEYNPCTSETKQALGRIDYPVRMEILRLEQSHRFLLSSRTTHSIHVFDDQWRLMFRFGGKGRRDGDLDSPCGIACTLEGILVADTRNNRICQFSFDGQFMRHVLQKRGREPSDPISLVFIKPLLWVTYNNPPSVRCYQICQ